MTKLLHAKGAIASTSIDKISGEEAGKYHPWAPILWGGNARSRAQRLREIGREAKEKSVWEEMEVVVDNEIERFKAGGH